MYRSCPIIVTLPAFTEQHCIGEERRIIPDFVERSIGVDDSDLVSSFQTGLALSDSRVLLLQTQYKQGVTGVPVFGYLKLFQYENASIPKSGGA